MMSDALKITRDGGVVTLTMNEAASRNALSDAMRAGLSAAVHDLAADDTVGAVILTGRCWPITGPVWSRGRRTSCPA